MRKIILFFILCFSLTCAGTNVYKVQVAARTTNYSCAYIEKRIEPKLNLERYKIDIYYCYFLTEEFSTKEEAQQFLTKGKYASLKDWCIVNFTEEELKKNYDTLSNDTSDYYRIKVASFKNDFSPDYVQGRLPLKVKVDKVYRHNRYVYLTGPKYLTKGDAQKDINYIRHWIEDAQLVKITRNKTTTPQTTKKKTRITEQPLQGIKSDDKTKKKSNSVSAADVPKIRKDIPALGTSRWDLCTWLYYIFVSMGLFFAMVPTIRQIYFVYFKLKNINKLPKRYSYPEIWPSVTILIPGHNEEAVIGDCIKCMLALDYPSDKLEIKVVNDRSTDNTKVIVDRMVAQFPSRISVLHRDKDATPGKPAALMDIFPTVTSEIAVIFDADYMPDPSFLKEVIAPFSDPKVGATMGRVIPHNVDKNILTRLIDLERRAGYNVELWARNELDLLPVYAGTTGGIRMSALDDVGGWNPSSLAEDTDLTCRLYLKDWKIKYVNHAECYEEATETWQARYKQTRRWAMGHNQCMFKYSARITAKGILTKKGFDAFIFIHTYLISFMTLILMIASFFLSVFAMRLDPLIHAILFTTFIFATTGPYLQISLACVGDRKLSVLNIFPVLLISSFINLTSATDGIFRVFINMIFHNKRQIKWDKTTRFRK